jgi:hypothetical protein
MTKPVSFAGTSGIRAASEPSMTELAAAQGKVEGALLDAGAQAVGIGKSGLIVTLAQDDMRIRRNITMTMRAQAPGIPFSIEVGGHVSPGPAMVQARRALVEGDKNAFADAVKARAQTQHVAGWLAKAAADTDPVFLTSYLREALAAAAPGPARVLIELALKKAEGFAASLNGIGQSPTADIFEQTEAARRAAGECHKLVREALAALGA